MHPILIYMRRIALAIITVSLVALIYLGITAVAYFVSSGDELTTSIAGTIVLIPMYLIVKKWFFTATDWQRLPQLKLWMAVVVLATTILVWTAGQAFVQLMININPNTLEGASQVGRELTATVVIIVAVCAPLSEELIMRGMVYPMLRELIDLGITTSVLISAFIFAILHPNQVQFTITFALGIALALSYELTRRIMVPIILHCLYNLLSLTVPLTWVEIISSPVTTTLLAIIAVLSLAWLHIRCNTLRQKPENK